MSVGYGAANDGVRQRIAAEMALAEPRPKPVTDVARAPLPHDRPDHAQWDEVAQRWEVWDPEQERWVSLDDGSVQEPGTPSGPPVDPTVAPPLAALLRPSEPPDDDGAPTAAVAPPPGGPEVGRTEPPGQVPL